MADTIAISNIATTIIMTGGLMGALGQGIRVFVGMKKLRDHETIGNPEKFSTNRMVTSIFMGFVAGSLAAFMISDENLALNVTKQTLLGFLAAGYAGTDFIEGFASRYLQTPSVTPNTNEHSPVSVADADAPAGSQS